MSTPSRNPIHERLALYRRYASVVDEQEVALDSGDLDRFSELNLTRRAIEAEVESVQSAPAVAPNRETMEAIERAVDTLRSLEVRQQRMESKLKAMRKHVGDQIAGVGDRRGGLKSYLSPGPGPVRIDVRR
ncbi:MAG: hypothetical protein ACR2QM_18855 [Longimicrobiales bacterium]